MDIKGTMRKYGYTMEQLAAKINGSQSSLSQVMSNPSPTLKMLDRIADGLECKRWEFFLDEMDPNEVMAKLGITIPKESQLPAVSPQPQEQKSGADALPFDHDQPELRSVPASLICPHCGGAFVVEVKQKM